MKLEINSIKVIIGKLLIFLFQIHNILLYLEGEDMSLTHEVPNQTHVTSYHSEKDTDELRFTHTFSEDTEITGNMNLKLWVSTEETDDMDIFAGIKTQ